MQKDKLSIFSTEYGANCNAAQTKKAKLVGASLEAPVVSLCADRKTNAKRLGFVGFLHDCIGQGSWAATSAARTNLDFRC